MLGMLQPWWLIALILVPVIRWLHSRQAALSTHSVSAVFLWRHELPEAATGKERRPPDPGWRRRALIAALLVIALASPTLQREQRALTVWLDTSPSMRAIESGETRLNSARHLLDLALVDSAFDDVVIQSLTDELPLTLDDSSLHWLASDGASEEIRAWAQAVGINRVIHVGSETENVAILGLAVRRSRTDGDLYNVLVSVANAGERHAERSLRILRGDRLVEETTMTIQPGETIHWEAGTIAGEAPITAVIENEDALPDDDDLSIPGHQLRRLRVAVQPQCGFWLEAAIRSHPALMIASEPDIRVNCQQGSFVDDSLPVGHPAALIRVFLGKHEPVDDAPYWLPVAGLSTNLNLPTDLISATSWPAAIDNDSRRILLQSGDKPLIAYWPASNERPTVVETVLNLSDTEFARQPEFAALIGTLVDAAMGRQLLNETPGTSRGFSDATIRPGELHVGGAQLMKQRTVDISLDRLFCLLAALILFVDISLLVAARWRAAHV